MQYFVRELFVNEPGEMEEVEDVFKANQAALEVAYKAYLDRREEIWDDLPKSVRSLLKDTDWLSAKTRHFVDDHFYINPVEELNFFVSTGDDKMFIFQYGLEEIPSIEPPKEEEKPFFATETLDLKHEEWDIDKGGLVHRILLSNGYTVTFKPKSFRWWKVKVEAES